MKQTDLRFEGLGRCEGGFSGSCSYPGDWVRDVQQLKEDREVISLLSERLAAGWRPDRNDVSDRLAIRYNIRRTALREAEREFRFGGLHLLARMYCSAVKLVEKSQDLQTFSDHYAEVVSVDNSDRLSDLGEGVMNVSQLSDDEKARSVFVPTPFCVLLDCGSGSVGVPVDPTDVRFADAVVTNRQGLELLLACVQWRCGRLEVRHEAGVVSPKFEFAPTDELPENLVTTGGALMCREDFLNVGFCVVAVPRLLDKPGACYLRSLAPLERRAGFSLLGYFPEAVDVRALSRGWAPGPADLVYGTSVVHVRSFGNLSDEVSNNARLGAAPEDQSLRDTFEGIISRLDAKGRAASVARPSLVTGRNSEGFVLEVEDGSRSGATAAGGRSVGFSNVDRVQHIPVDPGRQVPDRLERLLDRLDTGPAVSDKYFRTLVSKVVPSRRVPTERSGAVLVLPGGNLDTSMDVVWTGYDSLPGWFLEEFRVPGKDSVVFSSGCDGLMRHDFDVDAQVSCGRVVFPGRYTCVWTLGKVSFRVSATGSRHRGAVWRSRPIAGSSNSVGWLELAAVGNYGLPFVRSVEVSLSDLGVLPVALAEVGQVAGTLTLRGEVRNRLTGRQRVLFSSSWDRAGTAVVSVSAGQLRGLSTAGCDVVAEKTSVAAVVTQDWREGLVVNFGSIGKVKVVVTLVLDTAPVEAKFADSPVTPRLF